MKVYTSYYGNLKKLNANNITPIGVSLYTPKYVKVSCLKYVAPHKAMLFGGLSKEKYTELYYKDVLSRVNPKEFLKDVEMLSQGKDVALLCYEKPGDFCHRHLLADWLNEKLGLEIKEFGLEVVKSKNPDVEQGSLF